MPAPSSIVDLRKLLAERFPQRSTPAATVLRSGIASLDQISGGGLPKSGITELISPQINAGSASLIHALVQSAHQANEFVALIDGRDSFDPSGLINSCLHRLLWVRCQRAFDAVKAADLLLRDGNFPRVIVDLVLNPPEELRKIPQTSWYRLQRLVEAVPTACLVMTRQSVVSSAQLKLVLETQWSLESLENENATARLRFRVRRAHLKSEMSD
ncbi:MAG: hypothetical protein ABR514_12125 [Chthoniobacterales bacterium]